MPSKANGLRCAGCTVRSRRLMQSKKRASTDKRSCQHSMTVFFTADTHFGDHRVLNISKRPFSSVDEMDALIKGTMECRGGRWESSLAPWRLRENREDHESNIPASEWAQASHCWK